MTRQAVDLNGNTIPAFKLGTVQKVAYTGTAGPIGNVITAGVSLVEVWCSTDAHIKVGSSPTATTSHTPLTGKVGKIIEVVADGTEKISAIQQSGGGDLYVTELR